MICLMENERMAKVETRLDAYEKQLEELKNDVSPIERLNALIEVQIQVNDKHANEMKEMNANFTTELKEFRTTISSVNANLTQLNNNQILFARDLDELKNKVEKLPNQIEEVEDELNEKIEELHTELEEDQEKGKMPVIEFIKKYIAWLITFPLTIIGAFILKWLGL